MRLFIAYFITLIASLSAFSAVAAPLQETDSVAPVPEISLITCSPGKDVYELCGHSALRVKIGDEDMAVNYGIFDFNSPNFIYRFVKGETDYMVAAYPFSYFLEQYHRQGREVYEQTLNLTPQQAKKLVELLSVNLLPENRTYRYNYVKDNCSTRPLTMVERAIGDTITLTQLPDSVGNTFREIMRRHHANYPWYQFGIDLALGNGIDYKINNRERAFAPMLLMEMMKDARIGSQPAVSAANLIVAAQPGGGPDAPTPWYLTPTTLFSLLLIVTCAIALRDIKRRKVTRWFDAVIFAVFGITGCVMAFLVFISVHEATSPNYLLLWLNPFCLIVPTCIYIKKCRSLVIFYGIANFVALFLLAVLWTFVGQSGNIAFLPLILCDAILTVRYLYITKCVKKTTHS